MHAYIHTYIYDTYIHTYLHRYISTSFPNNLVFLQQRLRQYAVLGNLHLESRQRFDDLLRRRQGRPVLHAYKHTHTLKNTCLQEYVKK